MCTVMLDVSIHEMSWGMSVVRGRWREGREIVKKKERGREREICLPTESSKRCSLC